MNKVLPLISLALLAVSCAEIPAYKQLVADYKGRNIVFISMSVDKDKAAWEKMVN